MRRWLRVPYLLLLLMLPIVAWATFPAVFPTVPTFPAPPGSSAEKILTFFNGLQAWGINVPQVQKPTVPGDCVQFLDNQGNIQGTGSPCATSGGGTITGVTAGTGLNGGGTSGTVTLNLATPVVWGNLSNAPAASKTINYSVLSGDDGTWFDTTGASAEVDFTVPNPPATRQRNCYVVMTAHVVKIIAPPGVQIAMAGVNSASGGSLSNSGIPFDTACIYAVNSNQWIVWTAVGGWTVN